MTHAINQSSYQSFNHSSSFIVSYSEHGASKMPLTGNNHLFKFPRIPTYINLKSFGIEF